MFMFPGPAPRAWRPRRGCPSRTHGTFNISKGFAPKKGPVRVKKANAYEVVAFGKGPVPVKKANACEVVAFGKGPVPVKKANAYEVVAFGKGPEPVKKANACEARRP